MKSTKLIALFTLLSSATYAQTGYDAHRLADSELNGTARFVGMGGAMGALGADISVVGTNPAGIGLFRRNDFSTTFGFNSTQVKSDFAGTSMKETKNVGSFDQAGFVYSMKIGNHTNLRYMNLAFNYHKSSNLNKLFSVGGFLDGLSQTWQMSNMIGGAIESIGEIEQIYAFDLEKDNINHSPYRRDGHYPYLGVMGVRTELVGIGKNDAGEQVLIGWNGDKNFYNSREEGGIYDYDFNVSFNVQDKMYFGATIGVHDVDYQRSTFYSENIYDGEHDGYFEVNNVLRTEGTGIDVKLGAIFRPIDDSPFRFGFAIHTPTWYELTDIYNSNTYSDITYRGEDDKGAFEDHVEYNELVSDYLNGETLQDYRLVTPWKFNVNMGTTFAGVMAVGAEYEYSDYTMSKLRYTDGYDMQDQNEYMDSDMKGVHTLRLGMETRVTDAFSVRVGYNYSSSAFEKGAKKSLNWNDMRTDTEFNNKFDQNTLTVGLGYKGRIFYVDAAYKYNTFKSDFYSFSDEALQAAKLTNERHQALVTLGARF